MKFSYNWLKELAGFTQTPEKLAELLTLRSFEVEKIEKHGKDSALDIVVTRPNRMADAGGHLGMAREISAVAQLKIKSKKVKIKEDLKKKTGELLQVKVENKDDCPRYTARVIEGVKVGQSPEWLRERLEVCGIQSINNLVDAANFVMLEVGQPLHIFDYHKLHSKNPTPKSIVVRRAKSGEKITTLDDKIYELTPEILVIADEVKPIAIAGIKGGKESGVSETTTKIVLESANFDLERIRKAVDILGFKTDASYRFSYGLDPNQTALAIDRLAALVKELAGGMVLGGVVDSFVKLPQPKKILFRIEYANSLIGQDLPAKFYADTFTRLGFEISKKKPKEWIITVPTIRRDISIEEDLIEEAARIFGYENIKPVIPASSITATRKNEEVFWEERVRDILVGQNFTESSLYEFTGDRELELFSLPKEHLVALENPLSPETAYLVPRSLIKYVTSTRENLAHFETVKIFGIAKNFQQDQNGDVIEKKSLVITLARKNTTGEEEFYEMKGVVDTILESLGVTNYIYKEKVDGHLQATSYKLQAMFHPHRHAVVIADGKELGTIGEIHPNILENLKTKTRISAAEIDFSALAELGTTESSYQPVGKYPAVMRDISLIVSEETRTAEVRNIIETTGGDLLEKTNLFDYFKDEQMIKSNQKSLAFHLIFQSPGRTLTDKEIDELFKKIIETIKQMGWQVR